MLPGSIYRAHTPPTDTVEFLAVARCLPLLLLWSWGPAGHIRHGKKLLLIWRKDDGSGKVRTSSNLQSSSSVTRRGGTGIMTSKDLLT